MCAMSATCALLWADQYPAQLACVSAHDNVIIISTGVRKYIISSVVAGSVEL